MQDQVEINISLFFCQLNLFFLLRSVLLLQRQNKGSESHNEMRADHYLFIIILQFHSIKTKKDVLIGR